MKSTISISPDKKEYMFNFNLKDEKCRIDALINKRPTVVIQGLGFVGAAMLAAVAAAKDSKGEKLYSVIGVDLADKYNYWKIAKVNDGKTPISTPDNQLERHYKRMKKNKNVYATYSPYAYDVADVVIVDINLDVLKGSLGDAKEYKFSYETFSKALTPIAQRIKENALVIVETTVPPGTTEQLVYPLFKLAFTQRKLDISKLRIAHSYERVMPGKNYMNSITDFYRVFSGIDKKSSGKARRFFDTFINTKKYPLTEVHSPTASETGKILENSYRAMNIAFIQEWTDFSQKAGVNLYDVLGAIRMRPTHSNIMSPGFGVGGYCLPKDPLLADWSYKNLFKSKKRLGMSLDAVNTNDLMPLYTFDLIKNNIPRLSDKKIVLCGICYQGDVADTRYSPMGIFYDQCVGEKMKINLHDPLISFWSEKNIDVQKDLKSFKSGKQDIVLFAVRHEEYQRLTAKEIAAYFPGVRWIIDANNVIDEKTAEQLRRKRINCLGVGKGHWQKVGA